MYIYAWSTCIIHFVTAFFTSSFVWLYLIQSFLLNINPLWPDVTIWQHRFFKYRRNFAVKELTVSIRVITKIIDMNEGIFLSMSFWQSMEMEWVPKKIRLILVYAAGRERLMSRKHEKQRKKVKTIGSTYIEK
jgi:hypothetical protein